MVNQTSGAIIIADRDPTLLTLIASRLSVAGYQAHGVRDGRAAMQALETMDPVAMILDNALSEVSYLDVLQDFQRRHGSRPAPALLIGRQFSITTLRQAFDRGAYDCLEKPLDVEDLLQRTWRMLRAPREGAPLHVMESQCLDAGVLRHRYQHEAAEHRKILANRGSGMCPTWTDFRQFLTDLGPAPSPDYWPTRLCAESLTYSPGKVAWMHKDRQPRLKDKWTPAAMTCATPHETWTSVKGQAVTHSLLARHLGMPTASISLALKQTSSADALLQHLSISDALIQDPAEWLAPDQRAPFMAAYKLWHMNVRPKFAAAASPAFLYLVTALPSMLALREDLVRRDLWDPPTERGKSLRAADPSWRRYGETAVRVEAARKEFAIYRQYCLWTQIEDLADRVKLADARFRRGPTSSTALAA